MAEKGHLKPLKPQETAGQDFIQPSAVQLAQEKDEASPENAVGNDIQKKAGPGGGNNIVQPNAVLQAKQEQQQKQNETAEKEADEIADTVINEKNNNSINITINSSPSNNSSSTIQKTPEDNVEGGDNGGGSYNFRVPHTPEMDTMSRNELAAYCASAVTGKSQEVLMEMIENGELPINGGWEISPDKIKDGYFEFTFDKGTYYNITGYAGSSEISLEGGENFIPETPLFGSSESDSESTGTGTEDTNSSSTEGTSAGGSGSGSGSGSGNGNQETPSYFEGRGENNRRDGAEDRDDYYNSLPAEERQKITEEANKRFTDQFNLPEDFQIQEGMNPAAKEIWLDKRDEVIIDKMRIDQVPERFEKFFNPNGATIDPEQYRYVNSFLSKLTELDDLQLETLERLLKLGDPAQNGKAVTTDIRELLQIASMMDEFTPSDYMEYMNQVSASTDNLTDFRIALAKYLHRKRDKQAELENFENVKTKLFGLEDLYQLYKDYKSIKSANQTSKIMIGDKHERQMDRRIERELGYNNDAVSQKRSELIEQLQLNGFENIEQFEQFITDYEESFEQYSIRIAEDHLIKYRHQLYEEETKLNDDAYVDSLFEQLTGSEAKPHFDAAYEADRGQVISIKDSGHSYETVQRIRKENEDKERHETAEGRSALETMDTPLVEEDQLDHSAFSRITSKEEMKTFLLEYIQSKYESIDEAWSDIHTEPDYIYELDILYNSSKEGQGVTDDDVFGMILADKKQEIDSANLLKTIGIIFLAVVLTIVTLGAAAPYAAAAGVASLGFSLYSVYEAVEEYKKDNAANDVGLLMDDPSLIWVVIAIAGAAFDAAALSSVFKASKPISEATKAFNETGDLIALESKLSEITEISSKVRSNILKSAEAEAQANKMISAVLKPPGGMARMVIIPGGEEFARIVAAAFYMTKKGAIDFQSFLLKLKAERLIDDIGSLTAQEKVILKEAFEQGKQLQKTNPALADDLQRAVDGGDFARVKQILDDANLEDLVDFRRDHILNRHRFGSGKPGKTEFPENWSDDKIIQEVNRIANDPSATSGLGKWDSPYKTGTVDGIEIRVDFYPSSHPNYAGKVSTAYPTNVTPNPI